MATRFLNISSNGIRILKSKLMTAPSYMLIFNFSFPFSIGGGTDLPAQGTCLDMLDVRGASKHGKNPGTNSKQLARIIAATVLAGELSLMSSLTVGDLVKSHLKHNRSSTTLPSLADDTISTLSASAASNGLITD